MRMAVVAVFDSAMQMYARPVFVPALGVAIRSFVDEVNRVDPNNQMNGHPEDFELFHISDFDEESGEFVRVDTRSLMRGKDAKEKDNG